MGWGNCGLDSQGRAIGYAHSATCDHEGCDKEIDRGLSYACGDMHGETEYGCDKYFCSEHRDNFVDDGHRGSRVCNQCARELVDSGHWHYDEHEHAIMSLD